MEEPKKKAEEVFDELDQKIESLKKKKERKSLPRDVMIFALASVIIGSLEIFLLTSPLFKASALISAEGTRGIHMIFAEGTAFSSFRGVIGFPFALLIITGLTAILYKLFSKAIALFIVIINFIAFGVLAFEIIKASRINSSFFALKFNEFATGLAVTVYTIAALIYLSRPKITQ